MAGLGRVQKMFNAAILAPLALLAGLVGGNKQAAKSYASKGHPLLAKLIKSNAPNANRPGRPYPGYCAGRNETNRRYWQLERRFIHPQHYPVRVNPSSEGF